MMVTLAHKQGVSYCLRDRICSVVSGPFKDVTRRIRWVIYRCQSWNGIDQSVKWAAVSFKTGVRFSTGTGISFFAINSSPRRFLSNGYPSIFPWGKIGRTVKITTHFQLLPSPKKHKTLPPLLLNNCTIIHLL